MFPEELPRRLMKLFSYKNDIVLDPFNGAGTTSLVARKQGRRFIGIDVSEQYCAMALKRVTEVDIAPEISNRNPLPSLITIKDLMPEK
jgi:site-specific DNA-methyltransferase (adenine-specific)